MNPPVVSVIITVADVFSWSSVAVESALDQRLHVGELEVLVIAKGSAVDAVRGFKDRVRVIADPPGDLLNAGLDQARGRYVFFANTNDMLHPDLLSRLVDLAERAWSDVVVTASSHDGPCRATMDRPHVSLFESDVYDDLEPGKLFRRGFLTEWGLRFEEGDESVMRRAFVARALVYARTLSVAAGVDAAPPSAPLLRSPVDAATAIEEVDRLALFLAQNLEPGDRRDRLMRRHVANDVLTEAVAESWRIANDAERCRLVSSAEAFLKRWCTTAIVDALSPAHRLLVGALLANESLNAIDAVIALCHLGDDHDVRVIDGRVHAVLPGFEGDPRCVIAGPEPRHGLAAVRFDGSILHLAGFAYLPYVDTSGQAVDILVCDDEGVEVVRVPTEWTSTPDVTEHYGHRRRDYSHAGFIAALDLATLATLTVDVIGSLRLRIEVTAQGVVGSAPMGTRRVGGCSLPRARRFIDADGPSLVRVRDDADGALRLDISLDLVDRIAVLMTREVTGTGLTVTVRGDLVNLPDRTSAELELAGPDAVRYLPGLLERGDTEFLFTAKLPPPRLFLGQGLWRLGVRFRTGQESWTAPIRHVDGESVTMIGRPSISGLFARIAGKPVA